MWEGPKHKLEALALPLVDRHIRRILHHTRSFGDMAHAGAVADEAGGEDLLHDLHVKIAAKRWIPALDRRRHLAGTGGAADKRLQPLRIADGGKRGGTLFRVVGHRHEIVNLVPLVSNGA